MYEWLTVSVLAVEVLDEPALVLRVRQRLDVRVQLRQRRVRGVVVVLGAGAAAVHERVHRVRRCSVRRVHFTGLLVFF